jgi:hypothetical protein
MIRNISGRRCFPRPDHLQKRAPPCAGLDRPDRIGRYAFGDQYKVIIS